MQTIQIIDQKFKKSMNARKRSVAVCVFYDGRGNVLLQERKSISKAGEQWGLFGGGLEDSEDYISALKRELNEEIEGLPNNLKFEKLCKMHVIYFNHKENNYVELDKQVFKAKIPHNLQVSVIEGDGARWFSYSKAKIQNMIPGNAEAVTFLEKTQNTR